MQTLRLWFDSVLTILVFVMYFGKDGKRWPDDE